MKKISIMIPCYNEEENVREICKAVIEELNQSLPAYDYEILFIDNDSTDKTRQYIREICATNKKVRAIFNAKNFGQFNSPYYGICQTTGDCTISMCCDFQDPVELIPKYVREWENGYRIVIGIKTTSKENKLIRFLRSCYYKMIKKLSSSNNNISNSVEFLLRGAMKRRVNALSCAKSVNSDMGIGKMIAAVK